MDEREYNHFQMRPDTYPKETLRGIRAALAMVDSAAARLIDKVLKTGYLQHPAGSRYHGWYRVMLTKAEQWEILEGLMHARDELAKHVFEPRPDNKPEPVTLVGRYIDGWQRTMTEQPIPWEVAKEQQVYFDLRSADLEQFEAFVFDHEVLENFDDSWYFDFTMYIDYDAAKNAVLFIELFRNSGTLPGRYTPEQIEQGCWAMKSGFNGNAEELIWDSKLDVATKERLIEAMFDLYANLFHARLELFDTDSFGYGCYMWWDSMAYNFNPMNIAKPEANEEHRRIQNAMFRTLTRILDLQSEDCQAAALHGLNHVLHPDTQGVVDAYLEKHPELSEEVREWALVCARGEMM